ncbi:SCARECROW-LIKE protein 7, partial [Bienertia sinuspersici]
VVVLCSWVEVKGSDGGGGVVEESGGGGGRQLCDAVRGTGGGVVQLGGDEKEWWCCAVGGRFVCCGFMIVGMDSSVDDEMGPTEDTILALMDFLVDPLLPSRSYSRDSVSPSQEDLVAKQVHAVVLLYNYHQRKQHPSLPFLEFQPFCKLAMVLKPSLQSYFGLMQRTDYAELDDPNKHLSLTEKAIMNACDTSKSLHASDKQIIEGWPITKVAVFLVDSRKENCYLFHGSVTQGVWSVIEKEVDAHSQGSAVPDARFSNKKNRVIKRVPKENQIAEDTSLLQLAFSAVKESCGIDQCDLKILENHLVYSTSKAKTAVRLFIMQCTQINHDENLIPINDVMDSLRGPLVRKESVSWIFTPVVEYFHLLPYADKVSNWLMREESPNEAGNCNSFHTRVEIEKCTGSHLIKEPLSFSEQNCISPLLKEDTSLNTSESSEATGKLRNGNSCHLKEESVTFVPKYTEASEARSDSSSHLEEPPPYTSPHFAAVKEASGAAKGVRNGNGYHLTKGSSHYASQPLEKLDEFRNVKNIHLDDKPHPCTSLDPEVEREVKNDSSFSRRVERAEPVVYRKRTRSQMNGSSCKNPVSKTSNAPEDYRRVEEQCPAAASSNNVDIDQSFWTCSPINGNNSVHPHENHHNEQELMIVPQETDQIALNGGAIVVKYEGAPLSPHWPEYLTHASVDRLAEGEFPIASTNERDSEKVLSDNNISDTAMSDRDGKQDNALVPFDPHNKHLHKIQQTIDSKEKSISQTALKNLFRKREQLSQQLRCIADEISLCDRRIQIILNGGEDDLAVKIDSILEGCNEICLKTAGAAEDKTALQIQDQDLPPVPKRIRLSEAKLCVRSPCQELDDICNENFWMLPTYSISTSEGGFQAIVTVKGVDFECSSEGTVCTAPLEARKSAAVKILAKLRSMAAES